MSKFLLEELNKAQYVALRDSKVMFKGEKVTIKIHHKSNRYGSWERGFKFSSIDYGYLMKEIKDNTRISGIRTEYSANHGQSWHPTLKEALKAKGKVILNKHESKEMAFDAIQSLNREYHGSSYKWHR